MPASPQGSEGSRLVAILAVAALDCNACHVGHGHTPENETRSLQLDDVHAVAEYLARQRQHVRMVGQEKHLGFAR